MCNTHIVYVTCDWITIDWEELRKNQMSTFVDSDGVMNNSYIGLKTLDEVFWRRCPDMSYGWNSTDSLIVDWLFNNH